ncbi:hypothetical protein VTG60DRAFT_2696 [Thermothelomyces hinnuleus]
MSASIVSVSGCAAVVSTTDICSTCLAAACVVPATITAGYGDCPESPPTVYRSFPCDEGCYNIGCRTVYSVVTATGSVRESHPRSPSPSTSTSSFPSPTATTTITTTASAPVSSGSDTDLATSTGPTAPTPTPSQDPDNPADGDDPTEPATSATTASTAGAVRLMPFRLW